MILKCFVIDDEPYAAELLCNDIRKIPTLDLIGQETNPTIALHKILNGELIVDLVFLDVQMPAISGIEIAKEIMGLCQVIFISGYAEAVFKALEVDAIDYLRKPVSFARLYKSVQKINDKILLKKLVTDPNEKWMLTIKKDRKGLYDFLSPETIVYIESASSYSKINTDDGQIVVTHQSLRSLENIFKSKGFIRIHRTMIINLEKRKRLYGRVLEMNNGLKLDIGRKFYDDFILAIT